MLISQLFFVDFAPLKGVLKRMIFVVNCFIVLDEVSKNIF